MTPVAVMDLAVVIVSSPCSISGPDTALITKMTSTMEQIRLLRDLDWMNRAHREQPPSTRRFLLPIIVLALSVAKKLFLF